MATPTPKATTEPMTLTVDRWVHGGDGMGRDEQGRVIFVGGVVPGDDVIVEPTKLKKRWGRATLKRVVRPSDARIPSSDVPCELQRVCGGCPWMLGDSETQRQQRVRILADEIAKQLGPEAAAKVPPTDGSKDVPAEERLNYRVRARWAYARNDSGWTLGYRRAQSHGLVTAAQCPVLVQSLRTLHGQVLEVLTDPANRGRAGRAGEVWVLAGAQGQAGAVIVSDGGGRLAVGDTSIAIAVVTSSADRAKLPAALGTLPLTPDQFSQANLGTTRDIWSWVRARGEAALSATGADSTHAAELFAGAGTFTSALILAGWSVDAYDTKPAAPLTTPSNTDGPTVRFHGCDLFATGVPLPAPAKKVGLVLLDPPRAGAAENMAWIAASSAQTVLYVSCDLATAMRDAATLCTAGFTLVEAVSFDMFPHTAHQEVALCLVRGKARG